MPLKPVLEWATDLAAMSARFSASGEPMSGGFASLRTATPMAERARSTRLPATALPCSMRSSIASAVRMARSPTAPPSSSLRRPFVEPPFRTASALERGYEVEHDRLHAVGADDFHCGDPFTFATSFRVDAGWAKMPLLVPERERTVEDATMDSESARMSSAAEAQFRIDYPNSKPRAVKVVALDEASERVVKRVAQQGWQRATFFTSIKFEGAPGRGGTWSMQAWTGDRAGRTKALGEEVATADLVVMVSSAGTSAQAAAVIGEACAVRKVMTMALIIGSEQRSNEELSKTLATLRPYASMLVIASGDEYIEEML